MIIFFIDLKPQCENWLFPFSIATLCSCV